MFDRQESIFFENGGHVDFNQIDNRIFYRIIRHEFIGSHPSNPDIQNVDRMYAEGLVIDLKKFKEDISKCKSLDDALSYLESNKQIATDSLLEYRCKYCHIPSEFSDEKQQWLGCVHTI